MNELCQLELSYIHSEARYCADSVLRDIVVVDIHVFKVSTCPRHKLQWLPGCNRDIAGEGSTAPILKESKGTSVLHPRSILLPPLSMDGFPALRWGEFTLRCNVGEAAGMKLQSL